MKWIPVFLFLLIVACEQVPEDRYELPVDSSDEFYDVSTPPKAVEPFCGDKSCQSTENRCSCPTDCGQCSGRVSNTSEWQCVAKECVIITTPNICGNALCEAGEESSCIEDCPSCDDLNICTKDSFDQKTKRCIQTPITPCCGNNQCEANEQNSCLSDCKAGISLADYPKPFVEKGALQAHLIIGSSGQFQSELVIAGISVMNGLIYNETKPTYSNEGKLDSEVASLTQRNAILIGSPCQNSFVKELMPYTTSCDEAIPASGALIRLFKTGENTYAIAVMGKTGADVRRAGKYLERYKSKAMSGYEIAP